MSTSDVFYVPDFPFCNAMSVSSFTTPTTKAYYEHLGAIEFGGILGVGYWANTTGEYGSTTSWMWQMTQKGVVPSVSIQQAYSNTTGVVSEVLFGWSASSSSDYTTTAPFNTVTSAQWNFEVSSIYFGSFLMFGGSGNNVQVNLDSGSPFITIDTTNYAKMMNLIQMEDGKYWKCQDTIAD